MIKNCKAVYVPVSRFLTLSVTFLAISLTGCAQSETQSPGIGHVIVIGVDGMSPDGIMQAETPNMDRMMAEGAFTLHARAVLPTSSSPNWASMIMGAGPELHGITSNDWELDQHTLPAAIIGEEGRFPTIFSAIRSQMPEAIIGAVYDWGGFGRLFEQGILDLDYDGDGPVETTEKAVAFIKEQQPAFTFVHLDHVDHAGHSEGHGSEAYYESVEEADELIGQILGAAEESDMAGDVLVIVTSDHGGIGKGHGGESLVEIEIPFILYGSSVKRGYGIKHTVMTFDQAATVAFALGIDPPHAWTGRPIKSAFSGTPEPELSLGARPLSGPIIFPPKQAYAPAGGLFIDDFPEVSMSAGEPGAEILFTRDGSEPSATSELYSAPFTLEESTVIRARTLLSDGLMSLTEDAYYRLAQSNGRHGVQYEYFELDEERQMLPDFESMAAGSSGHTFEFRLGEIPRRENNFAIRFSGNLSVEQPGNYTFSTFSDDGSKLFVNGEEVVDNDGNHGTIERSGSITLETGMHDITVTYYQGGGGGWLDVFYSGPGVPRQIIPPEVLVSQV